MDEFGSVIYVGSFSKSIFPGLRLGYVVAAKPLIQEMRELRTVVFRHPPSHIQRTTAYFLSLGHYDSQINRMARVFGKRRAVMEHCIRAFGLTPDVRDMHGGSSFWLRAPEGVDTTQLAVRLRDQSVLIEPGNAFFAHRSPDRSHYRLAYSSINANLIRSGIALIAEAIADASKSV